MQRAIKAGQVQLGSTLAEQLGVSRDDANAKVKIHGKEFSISRVNHGNGTWQDAALLMDLKSAQTLFDLTEQVSRIEAIECTQEQCEATGLKSDVVLANELARITDQAVLLRREKMAEARSSIRTLSQKNLSLLQNAFWTLLALAIIGLSSLNSFQRKSEIGVLQSVGYGQKKIAILFVLRAFFLTLIAALFGILAGGLVAYTQGSPLFSETAKKFSINWVATLNIGLMAVLLSVVASLLPAILAATRHPAELIGKES